MPGLTAPDQPAAARWTSTTDLHVEWGDGHPSDYRTDYLRAQCPCAWCRVERGKPAKERNLLAMRPTAQALASPAVELVGRYGIRMAWGDGHSSGIYPFTYLREICPCPACRQQRRR